MNRKTPTGRSESAPSDDPFDFDDHEADGDLDSTGPDAVPGIRLNKYLAQNGVASRRRADELIAEGHVTVDGKIVTALGTRVDPTRVTVDVDGTVLRPSGEKPVYYLLSKPKGVVCTNDRHETRPRAIDLITDKNRARIYTVGRLDEDTEGLVILTNDGEFANRISHPRYGVQKVYRVDVRGHVTDEAAARMREGVRLAEGRGRFDRVWVVKRHQERSLVHVTLSEGKNREVRRVFAALDLPVRSLRRIEIGPLSDRKLRVGQWRHLTRKEVGDLLQAARPPAEGEVRPRRRAAAKSASPSKRPWSKRPPQRTEKGRDRGRGKPERTPAAAGRAGRRGKR
jgi:23S rRNA pseudouridine2605 synthase